MDDEADNLLESPLNNIVAKAAVAPQFIASLISAIGPLIFGFCLAYSSPTLDELIKEGILDTEEKQSWFGSLVTVGAVIGGPIAAFSVGRYGRKTTIMLCCLPFSAGWMLIVLGGYFTTYYQILYVARIICGIGTGMSSLCVPLYIGEIATKEYRGMLGAGFQLSVTIGVLLCYALGLVLPWRWLAIVGAGFSVALCCLMLLLPESPYWLISKNNKLDALSSLGWLRGPYYNLEEECQQISVSLESQGSMHFREFGSRGILIPLCISLALMVFQQLSGVNAVIFYAGPIFKGAGVNINPNIAALIVGAVQVVATFISCILMDRLGRRILLLVAGAFMCLSTAAFGVYYYLEATHPNLNWLPIICLNVYIIFFSLGWGPIPWLIMGEIFPDRVKGFASGTATVVNWTLAFLITKEFSAMEEGMQKYGTFWFYSAVCLAGVIFVAIFMPETKGKSLDEIQRGFEKRPNTTSQSSDYEQLG